MAEPVDPLYLAVASIVSFSLTLILVRFWIGVAQEAGIVGVDMHKPQGSRVAEAGGLWVLFSAAISLMIFESLYVYLGGEGLRYEDVTSLTAVLLLAGIVGAVDDFAGWKKGIKHYYRVAFTLVIAVPLVVVKAGVTTMELPLVGVVDFGLLYPLLLVPIGVAGASNGFNMLAGYNGLEAGMGLLLMAFTAIYAYSLGLEVALTGSIIMASALLAFLVYNFYPARVFPGNSLTYGVGAYYASLVIIDDFQRFGVLLFSLYFLELALFIRGLLNGVYKENFSMIDEEGNLREPYDKIYSVTHLTVRLLRKIKGRAREWEVTLTILAAQALIGVALILYYA